jgi:nicotinate-nucleotide pyrophosphorylase (carboxylating)
MSTDGRPGGPPGERRPAGSRPARAGGAASEAALDALVRLALREDLGEEGDVTSRWTVPEGRRVRAAVVAKEALVVAGTECVDAVAAAVDPALEVAVEAPDGRRVEAGQTVVRITGPARSLLAAERTALNFLARLSGVATLTRRFVDAVAGTGARVVDTRKTTPGWRALEKAAVRAGGGTNHRMGLFDMVLVKDNHIEAAGGVGAAARAAREENRRRARDGRPPLEIEVEVREPEELEEVLAVGVDRILLDNMDPAGLRAAVERVRRAGEPRPVLEASGNVTLQTVRAVAETGVDLVSVGALTHSAPSADLSLRVVDVAP